MSLPDALRAELAQRNEEHDTEWYVLVNDAQAEALLSGYVPTEVKAMIRTMLDWRLEDVRRSERPLEKPKRPRTPGRRPPQEPPTTEGAP